jgi:hypothetical protein
MTDSCFLCVWTLSVGCVAFPLGIVAGLWRAVCCPYPDQEPTIGNAS